MNNNASSLTVRRDEMSSIYQCHVENVYGTDTRTVFQCTKREEGVCLTILCINHCVWEVDGDLEEDWRRMCVLERERE